MSIITKFIEFSRKIVESKYSIAVVFTPILHVFYVILRLLTWYKYANNRLFFLSIPVFFAGAIAMLFLPNVWGSLIIYGMLVALSWLSLREIKKEGLLYKDNLAKHLPKRGLAFLLVLVLLVSTFGASRFFDRQAKLSARVEEIITANLENGINLYDAFTDITLEGEIESIEKLGGGMGFTNKTGLYVYGEFCVIISGKEYMTHINCSLTNQVWSVTDFSIEESSP